MPRTTLVNSNNSSLPNQMDRRGKRTPSSSNMNTGGTLSVAATVPTLTPAQMYSNFEEWIKMCTDNKVNSTNTWNFALIDYFHEMTFIREGDSINFQKASCTLDGCVKIYTSRVDSVATETGKLLSGLADSSNGGGDGDEETRHVERRTRRKTHRSEVTLLKDFSSIAVKKFDLDFSVDPLFKKTSADFDEGGARGLLLNHLSVDQHCKIIFDASDATIECDTEELDGEHNAVAATAEKENNVAEETNSDEAMDIRAEETNNDEVMNVRAEDEAMEDGSEVRAQDESAEKYDNDATKDTESMDIDEPTEPAKESSPVAEKDPFVSPAPVRVSLVDISRLKAKLPSLEALAGLHIVPSLKGFDFFTENDLEIPNLDHDEDLPLENAVQEAETEHNPFNFDDYDDMDYGGGDDMDPFEFDENNNIQDVDINNNQTELDNTEKGYPEQDFLTAMLNNGEQDLFNYFDNTLKQNWAGPKHWKLRRPPQVQIPTSTADNTEKPKRKSKVEFQIQFDDQEENDIDEDVLFETSHRKLTLTKDAISKMTRQLLPDDIHFSSKQLLQYFLKPMFPTDPKKKNMNNNINTSTSVAAPLDNGSDEPDIDFWAGQQNDQDYGDDGMDYGGMDDVDDLPTYNDQTVLTAFDDASFYHDNYDDPEVSVLYGDPLITNHNLKKSKPLYVNYARTAKRVDVKKLKDNLWKSLTLAKGPEQDNTEEGRVYGVQRFTDIVNNLKKMYPPKTMRDISVPFCFICLLHLANEKDLSIMGIQPPQNQDQDDFVLGEGDWMNNETILNEVTITQND